MKAEKTLEHVFYIMKTSFWILYILSLVGVWASAPKYLNLLDNIMKIVVSVILIYFFNPWKKTKCTNFHRKIVFTSAFFILFSVSFNSILQAFPYHFFN
jgi:hypothetical protein